MLDPLLGGVSDGGLETPWARSPIVQIARGNSASVCRIGSRTAVPGFTGVVIQKAVCV